MTDLVLIVALAALLLWEAWTLWDPMDDHRTISETLRDWNRRSNGLVALLIGLLAGHLFW